MTSSAGPDNETTAGRGRHIGVIALLVVGCLLAATAAVAVWARTTALDTDSYVAAVAPLPEDPAVASALASNVVGMVLGDGFVEEQLQQRLPGDLAFLSAPVARSIREVAIDSAEAFVSSDGFQGAWERINRATHPIAVEVLTGRSKVAITDDGQVTVDVSEIAMAVRSRLEEAGLGPMLPPPRDQAPELVLFEVADHGLLQLTVDLLDLAYWVLPILAIIALGAAIWLSGDRRQTWTYLGLGLAVAMALSLLLLRLARGAILEEIQDPINQAGIAALWDRLLNTLMDRQTALLGVALVGATAAFLVGPHSWAVRFRGAIVDR